MNAHNPATTVPTVQLEEPPTKGARTRERILDLAYEAVIRKGFAATSVEELVEAARITKSGFFYHFKDKNDLARQMLERYLNDDAAITHQMVRRARDLAPDPLHAYLVFLKLYAEMMTEVATTLPGCIIATIAFQEQAFDREVRQMNTDGVKEWRDRNHAWLQKIAQDYPPAAGVDLESLADASISMVIGGLAISRAVDQPAIVAQQVMLYREMVRQAFLPGRGD